MTTIRNIAPTSDFAFDILRKQVAAKKGENVFISPLSISVALGMTANGASGQTFAEMTRALRLPEYGDEGKTNNLGYANLINALVGGDLGVKLAIANSIWAAKRPDVSFSEAFLNANREYFKAQVNFEDFADPATVSKMNAWITEATNKKITSVVNKIDPDVVMFLINAVYFKGEWTEKFDKALTTQQPFKGVGGEKLVPLMFRHGQYRTGRGDNFQTVAIPFGTAEKRCSLFVLLPNEGTTAEEVVNGLTGQSFFAAMKNLWKMETHLHMPKFEVEFDSVLNDILKEQGMPSAFGSDADFSRMCANAKLFISKVAHKVYARFDEEGGEAAAFTRVDMGLESMSPVAHIRVDRPFVAVLADEDTGAVAFAGLMNNPEAPKS